MSRLTSCPDRHVLLQFRSGQLCEDEAQPLRKHLLACAHCTSFMSSLSRNDPRKEPVPSTKPSCSEMPRTIETAEQKPWGQTTVSQAGPLAGGNAAVADNPSTVRGQSETAGVSVVGYEILDELGRGGMGVVYRARQAGLERLVALKMILGAEYATSGAIDRFRAEAEAVARLQHTNIVQVYQVGEHEGRPFFSMEFVGGGTLAQRLHGTPQTPRAAAELVEILARAVHAAHQRGVVHRDLKPGNILLAEDGTPKITDFGLAKRLDSAGGQTQTGAVLGTPCYMSPEQATGKKNVGPAADLYALGATLYECLTGRPPFLGESSLDTLQQVLTQEPVPPSHLQPKVPRDLETICLKCLEKTPERRYAGADALADDLARFLRAEPILARPVGRPERVWKWVKRRPVDAALAATIFLAVFGALGGALAFAWHADENAREQSRLREDADVARGQAEEAAGKEKQQRLKAEAAAEAEKKARAAEEAQLRGTEAVAGVLESVLNDLRPETNGQNLKQQMVQRLEAIAANLEKNYQGEPLVRAKIRHVLGCQQMQFGEYHKSVALLEQAFAAYRKHRPPDHPETLVVMSHLGISYQFAGQTAKAVAMLEETLAKMKAKEKPDPSVIERTIHGLGLAYAAAGQLDKAVPLHEEDLARTKARLGPDHRETLTSMGSLAEAYRQDGQLEKALALHQETLAKSKAKFGPDHPASVYSLYHVAITYLEAGQFHKGLPLLEEVLPKYKAIYGPTHPNVLRATGSLGNAYREADQLDKALPLLKESLANTKAKLGPDHPDTLECMANVAEVWHWREQLDKALPLFEEVLAKRKAKLGTDHISTLGSMCSLGQAYADAGRLDKAAALMEELLTKLKTRRGPDDIDTLGQMVQMGAMYLRHDQLNKALPLLEEMLTRAKKARPEKARPDLPNILNGMFWLGAVYLYGGRLGKALPLLEEAAAKCKAKFGADHRSSLAAMDHLGLAYLAAKRPAEAEPLLRESFTHRSKKTPDNWRTFVTQAVLGGALLAQRKYKEAEPLLLKGYEGMKKRQASMYPLIVHHQLRDTVRWLVQLHEETGRPDQAAVWRKRLDEMKKSQTAPKQ